MSGHESELTYRDVRAVLALLDGWGHGRIHFSDGELEVDAYMIESHATSASVHRLNVPSPSIGLFRAARLVSMAGEPSGEVAIIGHVDAPGLSTPVRIGATCRLVELLVEDGEFVEYGQSLAVIAQ